MHPIPIPSHQVRLDWPWVDQVGGAGVIQTDTRTASQFSFRHGGGGSRASGRSGRSRQTRSLRRSVRVVSFSWFSVRGRKTGGVLAMSPPRRSVRWIDATEGKGGGEGRHAARRPAEGGQIWARVIGVGVDCSPLLRSHQADRSRNRQTDTGPTART